MPQFLCPSILSRLLSQNLRLQGFIFYLNRELAVSLERPGNCDLVVGPETSSVSRFERRDRLERTLSEVNTIRGGGTRAEHLQQKTTSGPSHSTRDEPASYNSTG